MHSPDAVQIWGQSVPESSALCVWRKSSVVLAGIGQQRRRRGLHVLLPRLKGYLLVVVKLQI